MNIKSIAALLAAGLLAPGCSTMKTTAERDPGYDFGSIGTYRWIDGPAKVLEDADTYINDDIPLAIDHELARRNLRKVSSGADIQVAYYLKLRAHQEYTDTTQQDRDFSGGFTYSRDSKSWNYAERQPDINVYTVEIGTLTLLVYDAKTGKRIWRGTLKTKIDRSRPRAEQVELIRSAAEKLMEKFPIQPASR